MFTNIFPPFGEAEIKRVPVEGVVLQMKAMGLLHVSSFPFPEPPPRAAIEAATRSSVQRGDGRGASRRVRRASTSLVAPPR